MDPINPISRSMFSPPVLWYKRHPARSPCRQTGESLVKLAYFVLLVIGLACFAVAENTLTVATYNIHHAEGTDGVLDVDRIAGILREINADVIFLQEVDRNLPRTGHRDLPALFSEKLGMPVFFEANYRFDGGEYGNATLTRLPVLEHRNMALPNPVSAEPRGCLTVTVEWQGTAIDLMNTHLGLNGQERLAQAEAIVAAMGKNPVILGGDMNENLTAPAMQRFTAKLKDTLMNRTEDTTGTVPSNAPRRRIDYILAADMFETVSSTIVFNDITRIASDHLPYAVVLRQSAPAE